VFSKSKIFNQVQEFVLEFQLSWVCVLIKIIIYYVLNTEM